MTDPIADMLTRIRNAEQAKFDSVVIPSSKQKAEIARLLKQEGFINDYIIDGDVKPNIVITLKYGRNKQPAIKGLKRISKPGLRVYAGADELPRVLNGLGVAIISTSAGMMTDKDCRKQHVGGEVIAYIW
jgi:small subunit ribosomal protein S8